MASKVNEALQSYRQLNQVLSDLDGRDVLKALRIEYNGRKRKAVLARLRSRAVRINEQKYAKHLKERYA